MQSLRPFVSQAQGMNDLLNWAAVIDEGIVQGKDGSLMAGWFYRGPDVASSTEDERNALCVRVNAALTRLGGGWAQWTETARTDAAEYPPPEASHFPDRISRMLDDERRVMFEAEGKQFESDYAIIVQYTPPLRRNSRILDIIYDEDPERRNTPGERILEQFCKDLTAIEDSISNSLLLRRMRGDVIKDLDGTEHLTEELVNYLHYCLNNQILALKVPDNGGYLDAYIGLKDFWTGDRPMYGDEHIAIIRIQGFPERSFPQILTALDSLEICYRWSTRFIYLDPPETVSQLNKLRRKWQQGIRGFLTQLFRTQGGTVNEDALLMSQQAQEAIGIAHSGQVKYGYHTPVVILRNSDLMLLEEQARLVRQAIWNQNFAAEIETFNTVEAWLGSLPGHPIPNVRRPLEHTDNVSNLLPLTSVWTGSPIHPNPLYPPNSPPLFYAKSTGATPFRCSLHHGQLGHVLMFGPPRTGKSFALARFAWSELRYPGATVCVLEKGRTMKTPCQALRGLHYEIAGDGSPSFCPLGDLDTETDRAEAADWVAICFELQHQRLPSPHHTDAIHRALVLLAAGQDRSITHFIATVQDQEVREAMHYYSLAGTMGHLYDAESDGLAEHHFIVHEIGELMALSDKASIPAILHIFRKFRRQLKGQPAMLIFDEGWLVFDSETLSEKLRMALKDLPKLCCQVILATHSLSEAFRSNLFSILVESCPYKILLPNPSANTSGTESHPGPRDLYLAMGLNEVEIDIICYAVPQQDMYITCPEGRRLIRLDPGPLEQALCGISDPKDLERIEQIQRHHGDEWPEAWARERTQGRVVFLEAAE